MSFGLPSVKGLLYPFSTRRVTFLIIFAVVGSATVIHDPDFYFHLVAGEYILTHRALPHTDVFSFTMFGAPWHMHEWLFEAVIAGVYAGAGESAVVWSIAAAGLAAVYLLFCAGSGAREGSLFPLLPALIVMVLYLPYVTQRPQVITYLFFAIYLSALFGFKYRNRMAGLYWLPPLMLVWVNSHGGYLLGMATLGLFIAGEWLSWWRGGKPAVLAAAIKPLLRILLLTVAASLLNPYFIGHWLFPFELMNMRAMGVISEWRPPDWSDPYIQGYLLCVVLFIGRYLCLKKRPDPTEWLLPGSLILASLIAVRHVPLALLAMLPFFLQTLSRPSCLSAVLKRRRSEAGGNDLGSKENLFNAVLLGSVAGALFILSPQLKSGQRQLKQSILPVKAVDFIEQRNIQGRLFNQYRYGGYLLYRLYPPQRVFIDIRADMYGDAMMHDYSTIFFAAKGWEETFARYRFDTVLCEQDAPLVQPLLAKGEFRLAYRDDKNVVLVRKSDP